MDAVPEVRAGHVVADAGAVRQTEGIARLLSDRDARLRRCGAVVLAPLRRVRERLDGRTELFGGHEVQVLDVVRVLSGRLGTGRRLGDGNKSVPSNTRVVDAVVRRVQDTTIDASLIETLAGVVPGQNGHGLLPF